jgi:hypothetical protein
MTLTLSPELEQKIARRASERGLSVDEIAAEILDRELSQRYAEEEISRLSAKQFLEQGPAHPNTKGDWPDHFYSRETLYDEHPIYRFPKFRPSADEVESHLQELASTDRPARDYPVDFFSREVMYADHD